MRSIAYALLVSGCGLLASNPSVAASSVAFTFQDLGTLGGPQSYAFGINNDGVIVGYAEAPTQNGTTPVQHAVVWQAGKVIDLGTGTARGINSLGHITGSTLNANGQPMTTRWIDNSPTTLGQGLGFSINDQDQIVGTSPGTDGLNHPTVWRNGVATSLNALPGFATSINNSGHVVGYTSVTNADGTISYTALKWGVDNASSILSGNAMANAINDADVIVGTSTYNNTLVWYPSGAGKFFYPGSTSSSAYAINKAGLVVGHGFGEGNLWDVASGTPTYIASLMNVIVNRPANLVQLMPYGINDKNQIVGGACYMPTGGGTQYCHAFLLTPTTPPSCEVSSSIQNISKYAFQMTTTLSNNLSVNSSNWQVNVVLKDKTLIYKASNAKIKASNGTNVTATPLASNQTIAANASTTFTFNGSKLPTTTPSVTSLTATLGGQACTVR